MDDRRPFLDAIIASPDDDTPRLVYADWLEENGNAERAEFIRAQCELARIKPLALASKPISEERCHLVILSQREHLLLHGQPGTSLHDQNDTKWRNEAIRPWVVHGFKDVDSIQSASRVANAIFRTGEFYRGFLDTVSSTLADWLSHGQAIVREHPVRPHAGMVTDRSPFRLGGVFTWYKGKGRTPSRRSTLPGDVFEALDGGVIREGPTRRCKSFRTEEIAMLELSRVLIELVRTQPQSERTPLERAPSLP